MTHYADDMATGGPVRPKLRIAGRPKEGGEETLVFLEDPPETPIATHWRGKRVPHYKSGCPHCLPDTDNETTPMWYVGSCTTVGELVIVEMTLKCYRAAKAMAREKPLESGVNLFGQPLEDTATLCGGLL